MASTQSEAVVPVAAKNTNVSASNESSLITADEYRVGDLVWCKITRYPYWPAQVQDPNHASDYALRRRRDGCSHFVYLLGEHMNAWCEPSQLVPFVQNFDRLSKAETKLTLFVKAMEEAAGVLASKSDDVATGSDKAGGAAEVLTTLRKRKRSKYLSPPYSIDWSAFKKGSKSAQQAKENSPSEDVHVSGGSPVEEGNGMASLVPDKRDDDANAVSELNAIREKLEVTSVILKAYHRKFSDRDKASVADDLNHLMEEVETMTRKVLRLAESTSMSLLPTTPSVPK